MPILPQQQPAADPDSSAGPSPSVHFGPASHVPPYHFVKGPESAMMIEAREKILCPISGSIFVKKLLQKQRKNQPMSSLMEVGDMASGVSVKRPKAPDLTDEPEAKKPKKGAKAGAKSKSKSKAKAKASAAPIIEENEDSLQADIVDCGELGITRPRTWIDDVLVAIYKTFSFCNVDMAEAMTAKNTPVSLHSTVGSLLSICLEFAFSGSVIWNGRPVKEWSKLRPCIQGFLVKMIYQAKGSLPAGDCSEVLSKILHEASLDASSSQASVQGVSSQKTLLQQPDVLKKVQKFVEANRRKILEQQPSFAAYVGKVKRNVCSCGVADVDGECSFHHTRSHTIADTSFGFAAILRGDLKETEDEEPLLPIDVPLVALEALLAVQTADDARKVGKPKESVESQQEEDPLDLLTLLGKDCKFLLSEAGSEDKADWVLNEALISRMVTSSCLYMFNAWKIMMEIPAPGSSSQQKKQLLTMEDVDSQLLFKALSLFTDIDKDKDGKIRDYIMEMEGSFYLQKGTAESPPDRGVEAWSAFWHKALHKMVSAALKRLSGTDGQVNRTEIEKMDALTVFPLQALPSSSYPKSNAASLLKTNVAMVKEEEGEGAATKTTHEVSEGQAGVEGKETQPGSCLSTSGQASSESKAKELMPGLPMDTSNSGGVCNLENLTFGEVYHLATTSVAPAKPVDVRDIVCIQNGISNHLLQYATRLGQNLRLRCMILYDVVREITNVRRVRLVR